MFSFFTSVTFQLIISSMFFQLLYIHLFRPFLRYSEEDSPLPPTVSPRNTCTKAAAQISSHFRLYKRVYGLEQICNVAVFFLQSACMVHLLNLPDRTAKRDISLAFAHFEEIGHAWPCAHRAIGILGFLAVEWEIELPEAAETVLAQGNDKYDLSKFLGRPDIKARSFSRAFTGQVPSLDELDDYDMLGNPGSHSNHANQKGKQSSAADTLMFGMGMHPIPEMEDDHNLPSTRISDRVLPRPSFQTQPNTAASSSRHRTSRTASLPSLFSGLDSLLNDPDQSIQDGGFRGERESDGHS